MHLAAADVTLVTEPAALDTPGSGNGFRLFDLDGRTAEVSSDLAVRPHRKIEEREAIPIRLSHAVVNSARREATRPGLPWRPSGPPRLKGALPGPRNVPESRLQRAERYFSGR